MKLQKAEDALRVERERIEEEEQKRAAEEKEKKRLAANERKKRNAEEKQKKKERRRKQDLDRRKLKKLKEQEIRDQEIRDQEIRDQEIKEEYENENGDDGYQDYEGDYWGESGKGNESFDQGDGDAISSSSSIASGGALGTKKQSRSGRQIAMRIESSQFHDNYTHNSSSRSNSNTHSSSSTSTMPSVHHTSKVYVDGGEERSLNNFLLEQGAYNHGHLETLLVSGKKVMLTDLPRYVSHLQL